MKPKKPKLDNPRSIRLTSEGLQALKVLKRGEGVSDGQIISDVLVATAANVIAEQPVQFRLIDPQEYMSIQAAIADLERVNKANRTSLMKLRPQDAKQAEKLSTAISKVDLETAEIGVLRRKLANLARTTEKLDASDAKRLSSLINWCKSRMENDPEKAKIYELELRILSSILA
jgi:septal ring factor EnvC (AmiA/AmiB activator)